MKPHYTTTLVVDFDDTIAITHNRDWTNAMPNEALVTKLNALYADGWSIHIVTARGQLSCDGDCEAADRKYRSQIESWLAQHDVKYSSLSFQKKLAAYYIDDKGITPEQFVESFERTRLVGGWSGDSVYYDKVTDSVYKTSKNTQSVVRWFEAARWYGYNVPGVHSVIGDTIRMQYLNTYGGDITNVLGIVYTFASHPPLQVAEVSTDSYISRCRSRVKDVLSLEDYSFVYLVLHEAMRQTPATFSHGDCSISNIMSGPNDSTAVYFIDPINDPTLYSSWVIDIAKLYTSIGLNDPLDGQLDLIEYYSNIEFEVLKAHEIGHLCRMYAYAKDKPSLLQHLKNKINAARQTITG
jgi:hypothetical protein